jgi:hypothetical protein
VIADPPVTVGVSQEITDCPSAPEVAVTFPGAPGAIASVVILLLADEALPVPATFVAVTLNV